MTPKEKAQDIIDSMIRTKDPDHTSCICFEIAKRCALIAVDGIYNSGLLVFVDDEQYWHEVKQEIEQL
jgi:hypothetical protein